MRARNITASLYPHQGMVKVWNISFDLKGDIPSNPETIRRIEKAIAKAIAEVEFPDPETLVT